MPFSTPFPAPIILADGREIATLRQATELMHGLPALHLNNRHWQEAARIILVAVDDPSQVEAAARQLRRALREEGLMPFRGTGVFRSLR